MSPLKSGHTKIKRFAISLFVSALFVSGCSDSSDSQPLSETNTVAVSEAIDNNDVVVDNSLNDTPAGDVVKNDTETSVTDATDPLVSVGESASSELPEPLIANLDPVADKTFHLSWPASEGTEFLSGR